MEQNTIRFGREIEFGDIQKGQTILLYCKTEKRMFKGVVDFAREGDIVSVWDEENQCSFPVFKNDRIWLVEELRIEDTENLALSQKPFAIMEVLNKDYLSNRAPHYDPGPSASDFYWTPFSQEAKSFSSYGEASEYLRKYLTSFCKVVFLRVSK